MTAAHIARLLTLSIDPSRRAPLALAATSLLATGASAQTATFQGFGDLPGGEYFSEAHAVSADGLVVVGRSYSAAFPLGEACRWIPEAGLAPLGTPPGGIPTSAAYAASADGRIIAGLVYLGDLPAAARWIDGSVELLGDLGGDTPSMFVRGISADGNVVVGWGISPSGNQAFRWSPETGVVGLGDLAGGTFYSRAFGVSADGSVVAGLSNSEHGSFWGFPEAMKWAAPSGMVGLGDLFGSVFRSYGYAISGDGRTVVGQGYDPFGNPAVRWTPARGGQSIVAAGQWRWIGAGLAVSFDGTVIAGWAEHPDRGVEAVVWNHYAGMRSVAELLATDYGVSIGKWRLLRATGVSANGSVIVGNGVNPAGAEEGWIVTLPVFHRLDLNRDGRVDDTDVLDFVRAFRSSGASDFNGDGLENTADLFDLLVEFYE